MTGGTQINNGFENKMPKPMDLRKGKFVSGAWVGYDDVDEANSTILVYYRYVGLTVHISDGSGGIIEYWYKEGTADGDLVVKETSLTGYVQGAGTAGYLARWTDTDSIGNSPIYSDGTDVVVGGSTITGIYKMDVIGGFRATSIAISGLTSGRVPRASTGGLIIDGTIRDDGTNVGIGVAPVTGNNLSVGGTSTVQQRWLSSAANATPIYIGTNSGNNLYIALNRDVVGTVHNTAYTIPAILLNNGTNTSSISFYLSNTPNTVTETGRAFGTGNWFFGASPTDAGYKVDINGTLRVQNNSFHSTKMWVGSDFTDNGYTLQIRSASAGMAGLYLRGGGTGGYPIIYASDYSGSTSSTFLVDNVGNIVSGATSTLANLQLARSITASSAIARGVYVNNTLVSAANNDVLVALDINPTFSITHSTVLQVGLRVNKGNVLVNGTTAFAWATSNTANVNIGSASNEFTGQYILNSNAGSSVFTGLYMGSSLSQGNYSSIGHLHSSGQGVGLANQGYWFGTGVNGLKIAAANATGVIEFATGAFTVNAKMFSTGNWFIGTSPTDAGYKLDVAGTFRNTGNTYLATTVGGIVGIGTTSPVLPLDLVHDGVTVNGIGKSHIRALDSSATAQDVGGAILFGGKGDSVPNYYNFAAIKGGKENGTSGNYAGYFAVYTRPHGGDLTQQLKISSTGVATFTGSISATSLTATGLTAGRIPYVGTGGLLQDHASFSIDNTSWNLLKVKGAATNAAGVVIYSPDETKYGYIIHRYGAGSLGLSDYLEINANTAIGFLTSQEVIIGTNPTTGRRFRLTSTGNLEILDQISGARFQNTTGNNFFNSTSGNTLIGTTTDAGQKLQVNGTTLLGGNVTFGGTQNSFSTANSYLFFPNSGGIRISPTNAINTASTTVSALTVMDSGFGAIAWTTGTNVFNAITINTQINTTGGTTTARGFYYNPTLTGVVGLTNIALESTNGLYRIVHSTLNNDAIFQISSTRTLTVLGQNAVHAHITATITDNNASNNSQHTYFGVAPAITHTVGLAGTTNMIAYINPTFTASGSTIDIGTGTKMLEIAPTFSGQRHLNAKGLYINPTFTGITGTNAFYAIETVRGNVVFGSTSGNVLIGTTTDAGQRLQVNGTSLLGGNTTITGTLGIGAVSGGSKIHITTSTLVDADLRFTSGGETARILYSDADQNMRIINQGTYSATDATTTGINFYLNNETTTPKVRIQRLGDTRLMGTFTNSTGVAIFNQLALTPTINNTGTYSGTVRGLYYNPTLTSVTGTTHYFIESTSGRVQFVDDSNALYFNSGNQFIVNMVTGHILQVGGNNKLQISVTSVSVQDSYLALAAATTVRPSLNIPSGTAPTTPTNGDIWNDGSDLKIRLGGVTYTLQKV
jgi:hypothetical protein